jgi:hypothetical protein
MSEADELKGIARLLVDLWEAAQRLPEGSERQDAFRQINNFHGRVTALVTQALKALQQVMSWLPIQIAPEDCDLEVGELDKTGVVPLRFPCRRKLGVWYNAWGRCAHSDLSDALESLACANKLVACINADLLAPGYRSSSGGPKPTA